jgi:hypothetical protein
MTDLSFFRCRFCVCDSLYQIAAADLTALTASPPHMAPHRPPTCHRPLSR